MIEIRIEIDGEVYNVQGEEIIELIFKCPTCGEKKFGRRIGTISLIESKDKRSCWINPTRGVFFHQVRDEVNTTLVIEDSAIRCEHCLELELK
jgi:hypothetical protein